jgi:hypothetical protein
MFSVERQCKGRVEIKFKSDAEKVVDGQEENA